MIEQSQPTREQFAKLQAELDRYKGYTESFELLYKTMKKKKIKAEKDRAYLLITLKNIQLTDLGDNQNFENCREIAIMIAEALSEVDSNV